MFGLPGSSGRKGGLVCGIRSAGRESEEGCAHTEHAQVLKANGLTNKYYESKPCDVPVSSGCTDLLVDGIFVAVFLVGPIQEAEADVARRNMVAKRRTGPVGCFHLVHAVKPEALHRCLHVLLDCIGSW